MSTYINILKNNKLTLNFDKLKTFPHQSMCIYVYNSDIKLLLKNSVYNFKLFKHLYTCYSHFINFYNFKINNNLNHFFSYLTTFTHPLLILLLIYIKKDK